MNDSNQINLQDQLAGSYDGLAARLKEIDCSCEDDGVLVHQRFFYLPIRGNQETLDEWIDFIYWQIVAYCIPLKERKEANEKFLKTGNDRYNIELRDKAVSLFISGKEQQKTSGEPGELMLFVILEGVIKAPLIACKMSLKTHREMNVHGADGIHVGFDSNTEHLELIFGEAKIHSEVSKAISKACESIKTFLNINDSGDSQQEHDIRIAKDFMNITDEPLKKALLKYFDPYEEASNKIRFKYACFIGFDFSNFSNLKDDDNSRQEFMEKYIERSKSARKLFGEWAAEHGIAELDFLFFLIPFRSVEELRKRFYAKLGL